MGTTVTRTLGIELAVSSEAYPAGSMSEADGLGLNPEMVESLILVVGPVRITKAPSTGVRKAFGAERPVGASASMLPSRPTP